jgi:hypothetical protein
MVHYEKPRKAAGSSDLRRQPHKNPVSASLSQPTYSRPPLPPSSDENDEPEASASQTSIHHHAFTNPPSSLPQALVRRMNSQPTTSRRTSKASQPEILVAPQTTQIQDTHSTSSEEWDLLDEAESVPIPNSPLLLHITDPPNQTHSTPSSHLPSYDFPGTWLAALHDTSAALSSVGAATSSYASALTRSGIGKAGWSIGSALASTANRNALNVLDWAADRTGTVADQLPRPVGRWLKSGRERKREVRRARERRGERDVVFGDREGAFVLETSMVSGSGERVRYGGWEDASLKGGHRRFGEVDDEEEEVTDELVRIFEFDD